MKTFVVHYKKLNERKDFFTKQFLDNNMNFEIVDQYDRDSISENECKIFIDNYSKVQIAVSLSHIYCYKQISEKYDYGLIFEDDAVFNENFQQKLYKYISELPEDWDMLFIGSGCDLHIDQNLITNNKHIYKSKYSRCTDSYIVSKKCAKSILDYINNIKYKIYEPIDTWLNRVNEDISLNVFWAEPTIVFQGSQKGIFSSCIR